MTLAAELGTDALVRALLLGAEPRVVVVARDCVDLAAQLRHPPRVHDVREKTFSVTVVFTGA